MRHTTLLVCLLLLAACVQQWNDEPLRRSWKIERGMTEQQVIAIAGSPTRTSKPDKFFCTSGSRVLMYEATSEYSGGWLKTVDALRAICLDAQNIVIDIIDIEI